MSAPTTTTTIDSIQEWADARFIVDREAGLLAALFLVVQLAALELAELVMASGGQPERPAGVSSDAAAGAAWVGAEVAFAIVLLGVILLYKRAPEWVQKILKWNALVYLIGAVGASAGRDGVFPETFAVLLAFITLYLATDHFDVFWMLNNILAVVIAVWIGAVLAFLFGITGLLIALVGLTVYDHVFANKQSWMFDMAEVMLKLRLPVIFYRPSSLRYNWDDLLGTDDEEEDDEGDDDADEERPRDQWGIGTADLALPAGFVAAVALAPTGEFLATGYTAAGFVILGVVVACFRLRWELINRGSGAGLPALSSGALGGWLVAQALLLVIA